MRSDSLWRLEVQQLFTGRAWLGLAVILSLLTGSTFAKAVGIFVEGSRAALASPDLAQAMNPFDGILVPTFGSAYLGATLLLPFVAIRQIGGDRDSGALKLLLGLGCTPLQLIRRKALVLAAAWGAFLLIPASAGILWHGAGGHLAWRESCGLWAGHFLYGGVVIALSLLAGNLGRTAATSSLMVLSAALGSWALDFEGTSGSGWVSRLAPLSLTQALRPLERGLLAPGHLAAWGAFILIALGLAAVWLHPGRPVFRKVLASLGAALALAAVFLAAPRFHGSWDLTEDRRHSFAGPAQEALARIPGPLEIEVRLDAEDPRWMDLDRGILRKLQRAVPHLRVIRTGDSAAFGRYAQGREDAYGEVVYRYQGRQDLSRSTSEEEILPLIWRLTGVDPGDPTAGPAYAGHPLVLDRTPGAVWFRLVLPLLLLALWLRQHFVRPRTI